MKSSLIHGRSLSYLFLWERRSLDLKEGDRFLFVRFSSVVGTEGSFKRAILIEFMS